ncbi:hypothetical protein C1X94_26670 [Pseudomonas sp. FW306-02-H05-AB]|nr:hypothetical protein C1X94_26670 [Pseudomonas sp. FW306-02-H05-AB]
MTFNVKVKLTVFQGRESAFLEQKIEGRRNGFADQNLKHILWVVIFGICANYKLKRPYRLMKKSSNANLRRTSAISYHFFTKTIEE